MISTPETRALAEELLYDIEEHPETHDQEMWGYRTSCGTTYCIAGKILLKMEPENVVWQPSSIFFSGETLSTPFGVPIVDTTQKYLGLDDTEANSLFLEMDKDVVKGLLKKIAIGEDI